LQANLNQPVDLEVVIEPFYSAEEIVIRQRLQTAFPTILDTQLVMDNPVSIIVTVPEAALDSAQQEAETLQADLEQALARPVNVQVITDSPDPAPEATAEATETLQP
jgi:uncharacterized protein YggE